jgi:4'-phosphopantetheinyl transferase EntD
VLRIGHLCEASDDVIADHEAHLIGHPGQLLRRGQRRRGEASIHAQACCGSIVDEVGAVGECPEVPGLTGQALVEAQQ